MTIYSVNSEILYEAPLTEDALIKYELMGDYYVELPFDAGSYIDIPRGSYIDHEGTRYTVMENILPEPKAEGGYHYAVKFWAGQSFMKNRKLFWLKGANKESSFHITTTIDQFGQLVVDNMNEFMPGKWELSSQLPADALTVTKTISFEGDSCWDAVSSIAEAYGIEWWVHHDYDRMELYFGKLEGGNLVDFKVGEAITSIPSQKGDDSQYGTRFYVYGSNQNLPEGYGDTEQGGTVHHVSNPRLMLPSGIDYIDVKRDMTPAEIIEQVVIFEDVYPKNTDTVTAVTTVQRPIENAAEGQPQTFTAYQLIAANTPFLPSDVMENETLRLVFNSGALTGVEFEVDLRDADDNHIDPFKWKPEDGFIKKFELIAITEQVGDTVETLPDERVHPVVGDEFVLLGVRLSDDKVREAEEELLQRGEEWKDEHSKDTSVYNCPTNPVYCKHGLLSFALGQRVRLYDPRFDGGYRDSRIQGFEKRIWNEYIATYTIGDNAAYTRIGAVESSVTNLKTTERTIGMILDELASTAKELSTMFEMVEYNKTKMIRANYDFVSVGGVTSGGIGSSSGGSGGGGSSTLAGLNDVSLKSTIANDMLVYNGTHWVNTPMSAIKPDLTAYATKTWVEDKGYALNSALLEVDDRLANVETIFTADHDGAINKWSEVVAFLDGIEGDTLDSILAQFATMQWVEERKYITAEALAPYALQAAIPTKNSALENDAKYITAAALNGYATQNWVEGQKYLDGIDSTMVINALGYTPYNAANFTKANIKSALGISDWALASAKPTYQYSEIQGIPDLSVYFLKTSFTGDNIKTTLGISDWALAASKPSYKWSEINERPTKLSQFTDDVVKDNYLPIGGTAKNAEKLGNQAPAYYATATALTALSDDVTEFRTLFNSLFEKDTANNAIKAKLSLYSVGGITAGGIGSGGSSGGGGASYNRLDAWADYTASKSGWVLSALLGKDLDTRVSALANAGYITSSALAPYAKTTDVASTYALKTEIPSLAGYATEQWVLDKEYATSASVAGTYATQTALQGVDIRVQAIEYIFEKDNDGVINKWSEVVAFLDGIEGDTLDSILAQFATMQWVEERKYITAEALAPYALQAAIPTKNSALENDAKYITAAALNGYATQNWVEGQKYLDGIDSTMVINALGYTPYNAANFTKANIKSTLGISDWALASAKPTYTAREVGAVKESTTLHSASLNDFITCGVYRFNVPADITEGMTSYGNLFVIRGGSHDTFTQLYFNSTADERIFVRSGGLQNYLTRSWKTLAFTSDIPSLVGYATESWVNTALAGYLSLSGGTLTDALTVKGSGSPLTVHRTQPLASVVKFVNTDGVLGWLGVDVDKTAIFMTASSVIKKLLHSGNYSDYALPITGGTVNGSITATSFIGNLTGNAGRATKLATARNLWGQSFDGTGNVMGDIYLAPSTNDGNALSSKIVFTGYSGFFYGPIIGTATAAGWGRKDLVFLQHNSESWPSDTSSHIEVMRINYSGNVGIGTTSPTSKLHVVGGARITDNTTIEKNLWVDKNIYLAESESDGGIYFGDDDYAFIKETPDDVMTIASDKGVTIAVNHRSGATGMGLITLDGPVQIGDAVLEWDYENNCLMIKGLAGQKVNLFVDGGVTGTAIN